MPRDADLDRLCKVAYLWQAFVEDTPRGLDRPVVTGFEARGDDVLVHAVRHGRDGEVKPLWLRYGFEGDLLVRACAYEDEAAARAAMGRGAGLADSGAWSRAS